jgi:hypothetical protein
LPTQDNIGRPFASVMLTVVCFGVAAVSAAGVGFVARAFLPLANLGAAGFFVLVFLDAGITI